MFDVCNVLKIDDVLKVDDESNIVIVDINNNVILRDWLNECEINEILNRRKFFKSESSDEKTKTINFDSFINIKLKKIENLFFCQNENIFSQSFFVVYLFKFYKAWKQ